jgi:hypothetical protein
MRRQVVAAGLTLVVIAVIGLLYIQALAQTRASRDAWMVTRDVPAGATLDQQNVRLVHVATVGDPFAVLQESPLGRRAAHRLGARRLLSEDDLLGRDTVQVPVSVRAAPGLSAGDTLDLYAVVGGRTVLVGRRLVVVAPGNPMTLLVPAADEASWIALEANNVALFAAKSSGIGVPSSPGIAVNEAISSLSGVAEGGPVLTGSGPPAVSPSPAVRPSPSASPR